MTVMDERWCMDRSPVARSSRPEHQRTRAEAGMPSAVIRLSPLPPIFASVH
jgi:hypothetical protein